MNNKKKLSFTEKNYKFCSFSRFGKHSASENGKANCEEKKKKKINFHLQSTEASSSKNKRELFTFSESNLAKYN